MLDREIQIPVPVCVAIHPESPACFSYLLLPYTKRPLQPKVQPCVSGSVDVVGTRVTTAILSNLLEAYGVMTTEDVRLITVVGKPITEPLVQYDAINDFRNGLTQAGKLHTTDTHKESI